MHYNMKVSTSEEYFEQTNRKIDWEETNSLNIPINQADKIQKILSTEASIFLLRNASGFCGSLVDTMVDIRRDLIKNYETQYETYTEYNNFY